MLSEVIPDHRPLLVVPTPRPKHVRATFIGQFRTLDAHLIEALRARKK
jgi:hypothetical protein